MADNLSKRGEPDRSRINVNEPWELEYWTKHLNVSEDRLKEAVQAVGPSTTAVRRHLGIDAA